MSRILTILFLLSFTASFGQNYKLFNAESEKVFTTYPVPSTTFSIAFDSVKSSGNDSVYYNFFRINDTLVSSGCPWWGGPECYKQNVPVWLGNNVEYDIAGMYTFYTKFGDTLLLDFTITLNDTSVFYEDNTQRFRIVYEKIDTISYLNISDSAKFYKIMHTDLSNNLINSSLNNQHIIVAKDIGMFRFFQADSFPQVLKSLQLVNNLFPTYEMNALTTELIYDYAVGDEVQYNIYNYVYPTPPQTNFNYYVKYSILSRTNLIDSIQYLADRYLFYPDSSFAVNDTVMLTYPRFDTIAKIPFEAINDNFFSPPLENKLELADYCGLKLWTNTRTPNNYLYLGYCPAENCWGPVDTNGPLPTRSSTFVAGLGNYDSWIKSPIGGPLPQNYYASGTKIVYFKKDGISCGATQYLGLQELPNLQNQITLQPNPAKDAFRINSPYNVKTVSIADINGKTVYLKKDSNTNDAININHLKSGIYFVKLVISSDRVVTKKLVIIKD